MIGTTHKKLIDPFLCATTQPKVGEHKHYGKIKVRLNINTNTHFVNLNRRHGKLVIMFLTIQPQMRNILSNAPSCLQ